MNILMIDTSGPACGVAIMADGRLVYEAELTHKQTHSQRVMLMVDAALQMSDMTLEDMDVLAAVVGPGSFTGVRIGVSTVKALCPRGGQALLSPSTRWKRWPRTSTAFDGARLPHSRRAARSRSTAPPFETSAGSPVRMLEDAAQPLDAVPCTAWTRRASAGVRSLATARRRPWRGHPRRRWASEAHPADQPQHDGLRAGSRLRSWPNERLEEGEAALEHVAPAPAAICARRRPSASAPRGLKGGGQRGGAVYPTHARGGRRGRCTPSRKACFAIPWSRRIHPARRDGERQCARWLVHATTETAGALAYAGMWFVLDEAHVRQRRRAARPPRPGLRQTDHHQSAGRSWRRKTAWR